MARLFDSSLSQYLERSGAVVAAPPFAFSAWIKATSLATHRAVIALGNTAGLQFHYMMVHTTGSRIRLYSGDGTQDYAVTSSGITLNTWYHVCGVVAAADDRRVYLAGGSKGTDSASHTPTVDVTSIGRVYAGASYYPFDGLIGEAAIIDLSGYPGATGALKADYFEANYLADLAGGLSPVDTPGILAYWPEGGTEYGDNDNDQIDGYHLTPYNSPTFSDDHPPITYPGNRRRRLLICGSSR